MANAQIMSDSAYKNTTKLLAVLMIIVAVIQLYNFNEMRKEKLAKATEIEK